MALLLLLLPFILLLILTSHIGKKKRFPPGPRRLPLIGNLHHLSDGLPHCVLEHLASQYGPLMFLQLGSKSTLVVSSAEMAKQVFKTHDLAFSGRPPLYVAKKLSYGCVNLSFAPYGEYWREMMKITNSELLSAKRVQMFRSVRAEEVGLMIDSIIEKSTNSNNDEENLINLSHVTLFLTNNVLCRSAFGKKYEDEGVIKNRIHDLFEETMDLLGGFCISDFLPRLGWLNKLSGLEERVDKCFKELDSFYDTVIEEHRDLTRPKKKHVDLIDVLLQVQSDQTQAIALTNEQIKGVITDIFIAGSHTTSATVVWTMSELIRNPSVLRKAQNEVRGIVKRKGKVEESDLSELVYIKAVIKEGFRLHPPVPLLIPRETTQTSTIEGYEIPAKTMVFVHAKMIGKDPKFWEKPNEFSPERFLDSSVDYRGERYEFIPFGAGRRGCPGMNFGLQLVELVLANLLYSFNWEMPNGIKAQDLDMEEAAGLTIQKKVPLCLAATSVCVT